MSISLPKDWPSNMKGMAYGRYLYEFFRGAHETKPPPFDPFGDPGQGNDNRISNKCTGTPQPEQMLMEHQIVVHMALKGMLAKHDPHGCRGMLVYHSTGSGKTVVAVGAIDAAWDDAERTIIFATSLETLSSNPPSRFYDIAARLYPRFREYDNDSTKVEHAFRKRGVQFLSFAQLAHQLNLVRGRKDARHDFLKKSLLIIDEVQNIFHPLPGQRVEHDALLNFLLDVRNPSATDLRLVITTATPGDTPEECVRLLNILRNPFAPPITVPEPDVPSSMHHFQRSIEGMISFVDISYDRSRFPRVVQASPYRLPMSMHQFVRYLDAYAKEQQEPRQESDKSLDVTRKYSNMLYNYSDATDLSEFSSKLPKLLSNISDAPRQKHYVYSSFFERKGSSQGIRAIAKELEERMGYEQLTVQDALKFFSDANPSRGEKVGDNIPWQKLGMRRRYILLVRTELSSSSTMTRASKDNLKRLVSVFNSPENRLGEYVHVCLASQGFFAAIDLKDVCHIHIFEPFLTYTAELQVIGRAQRRCSHANLHFDRDWEVTVHRYLSDMPTELLLKTPAEISQQVAKTQSDIQEAESELKKIETKQWTGNGASPTLSAMQRAREKTMTTVWKNRIKYLQSMLVDLSWKEEARRLRMIDDIVTEETQRKARELLSIYHAMAEAAFDCPLYSAMHGIKCMNSPALAKKM